MRKSKFKEPKIVLVFNGAQVLIAIVRSLHTASSFSGCNLQAISFCCRGKYRSTGGYYFRHLPPDVEVDSSDLDNLQLKEYDEKYLKEYDKKVLNLKEPRKYHPTHKMARNRNIQSIKSKIKKNNGSNKHEE